MKGRVVGIVEAVVLELRVGCWEREVDRQSGRAPDGSGGCCLTDSEGGGRDRANGEGSGNRDDESLHFDLCGLALEIRVFKIEWRI
jgi:hypothetical protein